MDIKVYVSNAGAYNNGVVTGQWTTLPVDNVQDIYEQDKKAFGNADGYGEEYFVSDYEAPFKIDQYDDLDELNELADILQDYDTIEDVYNDIDDKDSEGLIEVLDFTDPDFFDTYFNKPEDAARAVFFGNIQNWNDEYIYFNGYGNLESMNEYQFQEMLKDDADDIIAAFKDQEL